MLLSKSILKLLAEKNLIPERTLDLSSAVQFCAGPGLSEDECSALVEWIFDNEAQYVCLEEWLAFLRCYLAKFIDIEKSMGRWNDQSTHRLGHDKWAVGWASHAMLPLASALWALKSFEVRGSVLECGAFKGSSTACLSLVCDELAFDFDCADSFEGLPSDEGHYGKGDFLGTLEEVKANVAANGNIDKVNFIQGWYSDTLREYAKPIALLWVDVDLQESTVDILENVYPQLSPGAVLFSDGFSEGVDFLGNQVANTGGEPAGFYRYFDKKSIPYCAAPGGSKGLAMISQCDSPGKAFLIPPATIKSVIERL